MPKGIFNPIFALLVYLLKNSEFSTEEINDMVNQIPSPINDITMSSYDVLVKSSIEKGIEKEKIEVIKNAKIKGLSVEIIADIVKLPVKRVQQILDNLENQ